MFTYSCCHPGAILGGVSHYFSQQVPGYNHHCISNAQNKGEKKKEKTPTQWMSVKLFNWIIQLNFGYFHFSNSFCVYSFKLLRATVNGSTYVLYENVV